MNTYTILFTLAVSFQHISTTSRRGALSYVVSQGCPYLTHYVRDNYFPFIPDQYTTSPPPSTTTVANLNWVTYVYDRGVSNYIPRELIRGLIDCGKEFALYGVSAEKYVADKLQVDYSIIPGVLGR